MSSVIGTGMHRKSWSWFIGNQFSFGPEAIRQLAGVVHRQSAKRVLLISDKQLVEVGIVGQVAAVLEDTEAECIIFDGGEVEPSTDTVNAVVASAREFQPDLFVAVGGGSNMDLGKAAVAAYGQDCDPESLFGFDLVPGPMPTLVCIPTTAGTGSEVTHAAIIKSSSTGKKAGILSQHIRPAIALVDPNLTLSCSSQVTAECGIDALTHATEAYLVKNFYTFEDDHQHGLPYEGNHPLGDMYAEKAISLIGKHLKQACAKPDILTSRSAMAFAASLAGAAFASCGVSVAHALEYPIGSKYKCSHGAGNGIVLPALLKFWCQSRQARIAKMAALLGVPDADKMDEAEAAQAAIGWIAETRKLIELPTCLRDVGGAESDLDELAEVTVSLQRLIDLSPVPIAAPEAKLILQDAL